MGKTEVNKIWWSSAKKIMSNLNLEIVTRIYNLNCHKLAKSFWVEGANYQMIDLKLN